ncbi:MAG: hypothetical protein R2848_13625 [Thermomicrobiales bacterium]
MFSSTGPAIPTGIAWLTAIDSNGLLALTNGTSLIVDTRVCAVQRDHLLLAGSAARELRAGHAASVCADSVAVAPA